MPRFDSYNASGPIKMLYMGHTGSGKTGSLISLASAGYNVRILDLDKGVQILSDYVLNAQSPYRKPKPGLWDQALADTVGQRLSFVSIDEDVSIIRNEPVPKGTGWGKAMAQLAKWQDGDLDLGDVQSWTDRDVLVIDGLSRLSQMAMNYGLKMAGRLTSRIEQGDWYSGQAAIERFLTFLYSSAIPCNVIMICHIAVIEMESGPTRGFPQSLGKALGPKIGQYFNHALLAQASGQGEAVKRVIKTNTSGIIELKSAAPLRVKSEYDLAFGLAEYFRDVKGGQGPTTPAKP